MGVLGRESDNTTLYRVGLIDKGLYLDAETATNRQRRVWGLQNTTNYQNWVERRKVMSTLVMEEWCKGTPLDATTIQDTLYNN